MGLSQKRFSVNFLDIDFWDVNSNYLTLTNCCKWKTCPLSQLAKIRMEEATGVEIATQKILLLDRISFDEGKVFAGKKSQTRMKQFKGYKGDIVVSKINARKRAVGIIKSDTPIGSTIHFRTLIPNCNLIDPKFLWLALRSLYCSNQFEIETGGQGKGEISEKRLLQIEVPFPSKNIQKKIVEYWEGENKNAKYNKFKAQDINDSIPVFLSKKIGLLPIKKHHTKKAFLASWREIDRWGVSVSRELSCQPDFTKSKYPVILLTDMIVNLQNGWSPKCLTRPVKDNEWGVLKVGAVSFGWFDEKQNKALPFNLKPIKQYEVNTGDLIISRANITQYVGACALVENVKPKLMLCDKLFRVIWKNNSPVLPKYLDEILKIPHLRWQIENKLTGASPTMKNISKPALMALKLPLPPLDIQEKLISEIKEKRQIADSYQKAANENTKIAKKNLEQMILGKFSIL